MKKNAEQTDDPMEEVKIRVEELEKTIGKIDRGMKALRYLFPVDVLVILLADRSRLSKKQCRQFVGGFGELIAELRSHNQSKRKKERTP